MTLWRLEWLRLVRTRRGLALLGTYLFFGLTAPLLARYRDELFDAAGGGASGITLTAPPPVPEDGIVNYTSNASQLGLLVFAVVAAAALTFDANRERSIFLRSRVRPAGRLVLVIWTVNVLAGAAAFAAGAAAAWYGTAVLLGGLPVGGMVAGIVLGALYLALLAAVVALIAARTASVAAAAAGGLGVSVVMAIAGVNRTISEWLPSRLVGALGELASGAPPSDFVGAAVVTAVLAAAALAGAVAVASHREV